MCEFASAELTAGQLNALVKKVGGREAVLDILRGTVEFALKQPDLLARVSTVQVAGQEKFVAVCHAKEANVGWMGGNFKKFFLNKEEQNVPAATLVVGKLVKASLDAPILAELGKYAETSLAYLFELLKRQSKGEDGVLLTNGRANIFYVRDASGTLWAVDATWDSVYRYWDVEAYSVENPHRSNEGHQVFSRDS